MFKSPSILDLLWGLQSQALRWQHRLPSHSGAPRQTPTSCYRAKGTPPSAGPSQACSRHKVLKSLFGLSHRQYHCIPSNLKEFLPSEIAQNIDVLQLKLILARYFYCKFLNFSCGHMVVLLLCWCPEDSFVCRWVM